MSGPACEVLVVWEGGLERPQSTSSDTRGLYESIHQLQVPIRPPPHCRGRPWDELSDFLCGNWDSDKAASGPSIPTEVNAVLPAVLVMVNVANGGETDDSDVAVGGSVVDPDSVAFTDVSVVRGKEPMDVGAPQSQLFFETLDPGIANSVSCVVLAPNPVSFLVFEPMIGLAGQWVEPVAHNASSSSQVPQRDPPHITSRPAGQPEGR